MQSVRQTIGGIGNLMFKNAYLWAQMRDGNIPDIYVQGEKYWEKYKDEIKQLYGHGIVKSDKVALHIRRGDYLKAAQFHTTLFATHYYENAVKLFPGEAFLVFCKDNQNSEIDKEDSEWCEGFMQRLGVPYVMHEHGTEWEDLNAMAGCKSIIMANSTFSWWAAYLGEHEKVVCPKTEDWFTDGKQRIDLLPEWHQI